MKQQFKKWALRLGVTGLVTTALLLIIIRNPILAYANKITYNNYAIFHGKPFDPALITKLNQATELLKRSEFHNSKLQIDICKNDGSKYPMLMQTLYGQAFA